MTHELKTHPEPFEAVWKGRKHAEFRKDDRGFQEEDDLMLLEWNPETGEYSGRKVQVRVTDVRRGGPFGIPSGYAMLSFAEVNRVA